MKAIILAAGMGTRLGKYTQDLPKGMLPFFGKSLIERNIEILRKNGIIDISLVTGYQADKITFPNIRYYHNSRFADTNMVESLFSAEEELTDEVLIVYSDIVYEQSILEIVLQDKANIGVVADTEYWQYWQARMDEPEKDIESFVVDENGNIRDIGDTSCSRDRAQIRYVGILKFSKVGVDILKKVYYEQKEKFFHLDQSWKRSKSFAKAYMTCLLQAIIDEGYPVEPIYIKHGWMEFDSVEDYEKAIAWSKNNTLSRFIHIE